MPASKKAQVEQVAQTVVLAVEQTTSHLPGASNADKKAEAMRLARLARGRFGVNNDVLAAFIEAAVATLTATYPMTSASAAVTPPAAP